MRIIRITKLYNKIHLLRNSNLNKTFTAKLFENAILIDKIVNIFSKLLHKDNNVTIQIVQAEFYK